MEAPPPASSISAVSQRASLAADGSSAVRADAEANVAILDYPAARDRFKAAQERVRKPGAPIDHYEASIIDTRARDVEALVKRQAEEPPLRQ